jgi:dolichol-phosphate mannosyltransferase
MNNKFSFAVVIPMANEEADFAAFVAVLQQTLDKIGAGTVYFVVDTVSKDNTLQLCRNLSACDKRFVTVWAPENKNVVDAYLRGYRDAFADGFEYIIEMDAGLSHDPRALPMFLRYSTRATIVPLAADLSMAVLSAIRTANARFCPASERCWQTCC